MAARLTDRNDRVRAAILAAAINIAIGFAIIRGLGVPVVPTAHDALKLFRLADDPEPPAAVPPLPEPTRSQTHKAKRPEGAAAPAARKNTPTDIVAPPAKLPPPPPVAAAKVAGTGSMPKAGAARIDGPGTGRGGAGTGRGSGLSGDGDGGGGAGGATSDAEQIAGSIGDEDYPRAALVDHAQGVVGFAFTVLPEGRIANCRVTHSSGNAALDMTTCRLAVMRFRFRAARDSSGRAIAAQEEGEQSWRLRPDDDDR